MDTTATTHLSLCSGYGGIDLGLRRAIPNLRTIAYAEIEAFACENLLARMEGGQLDAAPIWPDLKSFPWGAFSDRVDILSGGYPCQPFSAAGKRLGTEDPRHLWPFIADGIRILRPRLCFFENVEGHISLGLREVIGELESMGYAVSWGIFSAREVGAPHQRKRVFILAHRKCEGLEGLYNWHTPSEQTEFVGADSGPGCQRSAWPSRPGQPQHGWEPPRVVGNARMQEPCRLSSRSDRSDVATAWESSGVVGNAEGGMPRQSSAGNWREGAGGEGEGGGLMGDTESVNGSGQAGGQREVQIRRTGAEQEQRQAEQSMGLPIDESSNGVGDSELSSLSNQELAEIYEWMERCDNRTDELRLLGNGVVPATATLAFQTLLAELLNL